MVKFCAKQWMLEGRQADNYIAQAKEWIHAEIEGDAKHRLRRHVRMKERLYSHAVRAGNLALASDIERDLAKFQDLYPTEKSKSDFTSAGKPIKFVSMMTKNEVPKP